MNISRRSLFTSLVAAPAVITADRLMPIKLWVPTIYGDAIHDDYEGFVAWMKGDKVNILPRGFAVNSDGYHVGEGIFRISKSLNILPQKSVTGEGGSIIRGDPGLPFVFQ